MMKPETEALLRQSRASLLQQSDENIAALLAYWFETLIGEEDVEEQIDDLCLLLDYQVQTWGASTVYSTYTSWWEVEGYLDPGEGVFTCVDVGSLRLRLLDMSPKQFDMVINLAHFVRSLLAEMDGQPRPATGHEGLREMSKWLEQVVPPTRPTAPKQFLPSNKDEAPEPVTLLSQSIPAQNKKREKEQQRQRDKELARQARKLGYLIISDETSSWVRDTFRHECKVNARPYIWIEQMGPQLAKLGADAKTLVKRGADVPAPEIQEQLATFAASYILKAQTQQCQARFHWPTRQIAILEGILAEDAEQAARELLALWSTYLKTLPSPPPPPPFIPYTPPPPPWKLAIERLKTQTEPLPPLADTVTLPAGWEELLTREHLLGFLAFLKLPARAREAKTPLVRRLQERLESDATVKAQLFEVFAHELAVPPWELETLLGCTTTERKRWTEEDKLPVFEHDSFRKGGTYRDYPLFDRRVILSILPTDLEAWRAEHQALVKARRSEAARAAAATRKARQLDLAQRTAEI